MDRQWTIHGFGALCGEFMVNIAMVLSMNATIGQSALQCAEGERTLRRTSDPQEGGRGCREAG
ncbi:hypothetical protein [Sorangium sp. So ce363]|uniref:hypothetical protein n=1 Tax=Sorangium sp. So ce363 TaxID=3133304 RepID=UPI003F607784